MSRASLILGLLLLGCRPFEVPCTINSAEVDFGEVEVGPHGAIPARLVVLNPSDVDRVVTARPLPPPFFVDPTVPLKLQAHSEELWTVNFEAHDSLLHFEELILEGDGRCDFKVPLRALGSGTIRALPAALDFVLDAGQSETKEVLLQNTRRASATVTLQWVASGGSPAPFSLGTPNTLQIAAGGSVSVPITAAPTGWEPVGVQLRASVRDQEALVPVTYTPTSPRLRVSPLEYDVFIVGVGHYAERTFRVTNTGRSGHPTVPPLRLARVPEFTPGESPDIDVSVPPSTTLLVAEGQSLEFTVRVHPDRPGPRRYRFLVSPSEPFLQQVEVTLSAVAEVLPPCEMQIVPPDTLQLQASGDGGIQGQVTFTNTGSTTCTVDDLRLSSATLPEYRIAEGGLTQVEVAAGGVHQVTIAGPRTTDAGVVGEFRFHVFRDRGTAQSIELRSP